jgi:hypothetical protein
MFDGEPSIERLTMICASKVDAEEKTRVASHVAFFVLWTPPPEQYVSAASGKETLRLLVNIVDGLCDRSRSFFTMKVRGQKHGVQFSVKIQLKKLFLW